MSTSPIDHGLNRLAYQFQHSPKLKNMIANQLWANEVMYESANDILNLRLFENNPGGKLLDGLGEILGLSRPYLPVDNPGAFGFHGDDTAVGFTDLNNHVLGGHFVNISDTVVVADDENYTKLLRAKAIINSSSTTVEETIRIISTMFDGVKVKYSLLVNLEPVYHIMKALDPIDIKLLNTLPLLIGLGRVTYISSDISDSFGFESDVSSRGFTDFNDISLGGNFVSIT